MKPHSVRQNWHTITLLQVAITRAILQGDARGAAVLGRILAEELELPPP